MCWPVRTLRLTCASCACVLASGQLESAFNDKDARLWLQERCGADVASAYLQLGDLVRSDVAASQALDQVLQAWRSLHPLSTAARLLALRSVQRLVELRDYLSFRRRFSPTDVPFVDRAASVAKRWCNR